MQLDEVDAIDLQAAARCLDACLRAGVAALPCLGREEERLAVARHPRADAELGIAVGGRCIDVVDAGLEQHVEDPVGAILPHRTERGGAEDDTRAVVAGAAEGHPFAIMR